MSLENIQWYLKTFNELRNDELYDILALRAQIFVVEQFCPYADADGDDKSTLHLICKSADDSILAYSRIIHPGLHYPEASIGRIITSETARGTGLGSELMKRSIQAVESEYGKVAIKIGAQCYLEGFYGKFGFKKVGELYTEDRIPHYKMIREAAFTL